MTPQDFFDRYGITPKKANDPLRLGNRKSKRCIIGAMLIGASLCTLIQERVQAAAGRQSLQSYVEVRQRDEGNWRLTDVIPATTIVFFTSGTSGTTASVFPNWNNGNNLVECFGGGGNGSAALCCAVGGNGGYGGNYAAKSNITLGATFTYAVGAASGTTQFASSAVSALGAGGAGGAGTTLFTGGAGGSFDSDGNNGGGGGGGCAGKHGNGGVGGDGTGGASGPGGAGDAGSGGAGGATPGASGGAGNEYTSTAGAHAGPGGGGCGYAYGGPGGAGGLYGGGGGGAGNLGYAGGTGAQGLIVVTYVPLAPTVSSVTPSQGPVTGGAAVAIVGANFTGTTSVLFGAVAGTGLTVNSASSISITSPAHVAGIVDVTVVSPAGTSPTSSADQFNYFMVVMYRRLRQYLRR